MGGLNMFKDRIKFLRERTKLTQAELAKELDIGRASLSNYELGNRVPSIDVLNKIAKYFDVTTDYLTQDSDYICDINVPTSQLYTLQLNKFYAEKDKLLSQQIPEDDSKLQKLNESIAKSLQLFTQAIAEEKSIEETTTNFKNAVDTLYKDLRKKPAILMSAINIINLMDTSWSKIDDEVLNQSGTDKNDLNLVLSLSNFSSEFSTKLVSEINRYIQISISSSVEQWLKKTTQSDKILYVEENTD